MQRSELLSGHHIKGRSPARSSTGMLVCGDEGWTCLQGEMWSAAEVSSDGKLFREIKEQVGN